MFVFIVVWTWHDIERMFHVIKKRAAERQYTMVRSTEHGRELFELIFGVCIAEETSGPEEENGMTVVKCCILSMIP